MKNPLRLFFWLLGQDARLGLLREWGFEPLQGQVYRRAPLLLHQLGLTLESGLLYSRALQRFFRVPAGFLPPDPPPQATPVSFRQGWNELADYLKDYEHWVEQSRPGYRQKLLRHCPPLLRPQRRSYRQALDLGQTGRVSSGPCYSPCNFLLSSASLVSSS